MSPLYERRTEEPPKQLPQDLLDEVKQTLQGPQNGTRKHPKKAVLGYNLDEDLYKMIKEYQARKGGSSIKGGGQQ